MKLMPFAFSPLCACSFKMRVRESVEESDSNRESYMRSDINLQTLECIRLVVSRKIPCSGGIVAWFFNKYVDNLPIGLKSITLSKNYDKLLNNLPESIKITII